MSFYISCFGELFITLVTRKFRRRFVQIWHSFDRVPVQHYKSTCPHLIYFRPVALQTTNNKIHAGDVFEHIVAEFALNMEHTVKNQMVLIVLTTIRSISTGFVILCFIAVGKFSSTETTWTVHSASEAITRINDGFFTE